MCTNKLTAEKSSGFLCSICSPYAYSFKSNTSPSVPHWQCFMLQLLWHAAWQLEKRNRETATARRKLCKYATVSGPSLSNLRRHQWMNCWGLCFLRGPYRGQFTWVVWLVSGVRGVESSWGVLTTEVQSLWPVVREPRGRETAVWSRYRATAKEDWEDLYFCYDDSDIWNL
jgi:hypothetical protein